MKTRQLIIIVVLVYLVWLVTRVKKTSVQPCESSVGSRDIHGQIESTTQLLIDRINGMQPITVDTYESALPYFEGGIFKTIYVKSDTVYNDGEPSFYTYNPLMPTGQRVAQFGIDYNYTE